MDLGVTILASIWSIAIIYFIAWKLKVNQEKKDRLAVLSEIMNDEIKNRVPVVVEELTLRLFEATVKNYLLESKVVDKGTVQFKWSFKKGLNELNG